MSISRGCGRGDTSYAMRISSSVVLPRALSTATTRLPSSFAAAIRRAARAIRSASATEVPPNFMTTVCASPGSATANEDTRNQTGRRGGCGEREPEAPAAGGGHVQAVEREAEVRHVDHPE